MKVKGTYIVKKKKKKKRECNTTKPATTNVNGTYTVRKYKKRKRSIKTNPKQFRKWQLEHKYQQLL